MSVASDNDRSRKRWSGHGLISGSSLRERRSRTGRVAVRSPAGAVVAELRGEKQDQAGRRAARLDEASRAAPLRRSARPLPDGAGRGCGPVSAGSPVAGVPQTVGRPVLPGGTVVLPQQSPSPRTQSRAGPALAGNAGRRGREGVGRERRRLVKDEGCETAALGHSTDPQRIGKSALLLWDVLNRVLAWLTAKRVNSHRAIYPAASEGANPAKV